MTTALLQLHLFGSFDLRREGNTLTGFRGDKARALLAYLALQQGRPVSRQQLTALLWDGYPQSSAKASLRVTLSNVRQLLAPWQLIERERQTVQLQVDGATLWCDAVALAQLLAADNKRPTAERWAEAQRLYGGELLAGFDEIDSQPFQTWLQTERNYYRQRLEQLRPALVVPFSFPTNLLRSLTPLIGRQSEIHTLHRLVTNPDYPLVTVVGEGGVGKTRLALAVAQLLVDSTTSVEDSAKVAAQRMPADLGSSQHLARQFADGIWFVSLTDMAPSAQVDEQIALAIGAALQFSFSRSQALTTQLLDYIRGKALLLILDSFERLLGGVDFLLTLLRAARQLKILITSRQQLRLQAEYLFALEGLPVPDESSDNCLENASLSSPLSTKPSILLFIERARRLVPNFRPNHHTYADIAAICRQVNGLPLAIELAAAQVAQRPCSEIRQALATSYATLTADLNDLPPRHRSLRLVLDDSWLLLSAEEASVLAQCTLFQGGFTASAVAEIAQAEPQILEQLIQKSLLQSQQNERYFLHELVQHYASAALQTTGVVQGDATALRHSRYYLTLVRTQERVLQGEAPQMAIALIRSELMNIQAAWRWALEQGQWQQTGQASAALADFYEMVGLAPSGEAEFTLAVKAAQAAFAQPNASATPELAWALANFLCAHAKLLLYVGANDGAISAAQQALALAQPDRFPDLHATALCHLGTAFTAQGQPMQARPHLDQALALAGTGTASSTLIAILYELGNLEFSEARYAEARACCEAALAKSRTHQWRAAEVKILNRLAAVDHALDNYAQASLHMETALQLVRQTGARAIEDRLLGNLGLLWAMRGDYASALHYFNLALTAHRNTGNRIAQGHLLCNLGTLMNRIGDYAAAFNYTQQGHQLMQLAGFETDLATAAFNLGTHAHYLGDDQAALRYSQQAVQQSQQVQNRYQESAAWEHMGEALTGLGQWSAAADAYGKSLTIGRALAVPLLILKALVGLVQVSQAQGGDLTTRMAYVEEMLALLSQLSLDSLEEPFEVYLTCYQVLAAQGDPRAAPLLQEGYRQLQTRAALISDEALRRSFLEQVSAHRALVELTLRG